MSHRYLIQFRPKHTPHCFTDVLVIGAGIAGLSAAWHLQEHGYEVTIAISGADALSKIAAVDFVFDLVVSDVEQAAATDRRAVPDRQIGLSEIDHGPPAAPRREQHRERRVLPRLDRLDRVHDHAEPHGQAPAAGADSRATSRAVNPSGTSAAGAGNGPRKPAQTIAIAIAMPPHTTIPVLNVMSS